MDRRDSPAAELTILVDHYLKEGFGRPHPMPRGEKGPRLKGWQDPSKQFSLEDFKWPCNVGTLYGPKQVDVEGDCDEWRRIAPEILPTTDRIHGRPGTGPAHYWFELSEGVTKHEEFTETIVEADGQRQSVTLGELRCAPGRQCMVPPSQHPTGEIVRWFADGAPKRVPADGLLVMVRMVAVATLLARRWPKNGPDTNQHDLALHVGGFLARHGFQDLEVHAIVEQAATVGGDDNVRDRVRAALDGVKKHQTGQPVTGGPHIARELGQTVLQDLLRFVGAQPRESRDFEKEEIKRRERARREAIRELNAEPSGPIPQLLSYKASELPEVKFPLREGLVWRDETVILRAGHIGEIYAERGIGKTWLLLTLALLLAVGETVLGLTARKPKRVLYIDGEMSAYELRERLQNLGRWLNLTLPENLVLLAADWQLEHLPRLDTPEGRLAIQPYVDWADVIFVDNRSCLFDPEGEKDAGAWQPAGDWLLDLRRRGKAVLVAHHANRNGGARGHSRPEDAMDLVLKLVRPEDYDPTAGARFRVEFDKGRGIVGLARAPFVAALGPDGWAVEATLSTHDVITERTLRNLSQLWEAGEPPKSRAAALRDVTGNRSTKLAVFAGLLRDGRVKKIDGFYQLADRPHLRAGLEGVYTDLRTKPAADEFPEF